MPHEIDAHTKDFRKVLGSATGALYDEALVQGALSRKRVADNRSAPRAGMARGAERLQIRDRPQWVFQRAFASAPDCLR